MPATAATASSWRCSRASFTSSPTIRKRPKRGSSSIFTTASATTTRPTRKASSAWRSTRITRERRILRLLHRQKGEAGKRRLALPRQQGRPQRRRPGLGGGAAPRLAQPFWNHDGGTICLRTGRLSVHRPRRRRPGQRSGRQRPEPQHAARQDPPHRRQWQGRADEVRHPEGQPVRRPGQGPGRNLGLRRPQPLAHRVRPQDRRSLVRRRGTEPVRRNRPDRQGRQLRLEPARGAASLRSRTASARGRI